MSSEPQVTSSTATENSPERVPTRRPADLLPVYDVVGRWLHREPAFLHEHEPEHHLEELALMTVAAARDWTDCQLLQPYAGKVRQQPW